MVFFFCDKQVILISWFCYLLGEFYRYEACICQENTIETVTSASLEPLMLHSPAIKMLHSKGYDAKYKLIAPEDPSGVRWFTKPTLVRYVSASISGFIIMLCHGKTKDFVLFLYCYLYIVRFLQVIGSSEVMNTTNAVRNEMSQLEEARKFHLSLYSNVLFFHNLDQYLKLVFSGIIFVLFQDAQYHLENGKVG